MWNPFQKNSTAGSSQQSMGMLQALAMKKMMKMSPGEREKMMAEVMKPENKDKIKMILSQLEKSGSFSDEQMKMAKEKLGL